MLPCIAGCILGIIVLFPGFSTCCTVQQVGGHWLVGNQHPLVDEGVLGCLSTDRKAFCDKTDMRSAPVLRSVSDQAAAM